MDLFYLSQGSPYGDPIAEISEYKDGYLLKCFGPEEICLSFDYITKENGLELINHLNNMDQAFEGCGGEEIYNIGEYTRLKEFFGYDNIIQAIIYDEEVQKFIEKVINKGYKKFFIDFMEDDLEKHNFDLDDEEMKFIYDDKLTLEQLCNKYDWYIHA